MLLLCHDSWDRTLDVRKRPAWLRDAASVAHAASDPVADANEEDEVFIDVDPFLIPTAITRDTWEGAQPASNEQQLNNKRGNQREQLEAISLLRIAHGIALDEGDAINTGTTNGHTAASGHASERKGGPRAAPASASKKQIFHAAHSSSVSVFKKIFKS